jgi:cellulose synthase/poly-beta-1,6-N-acetylglucosamine synthase-like glycosyltransferase
MGQLERLAAEGRKAAGMSRLHAPGSGLSDFHMQADTAYDAGPAMLAAPKLPVPELPADIAFLARHGLAPDLLASIAAVASRKGIPACEVLVARGHLTAGEYRKILALHTGAAHAETVTPAPLPSAERMPARDVPAEMPVLGRHAGANRIFVPADAARLGKLIAFARRGKGLLRPFVLVPPAAIRIAHLMRNRSAHTRRAIFALDEAMPEYSARRRLTDRQMQVMLALLLSFAWLFLLFPGITEAIIAGLLILFYLATIFLRVFVLTLLDTLPWPRQDGGTRVAVPAHPEAEDLPLYSILVPLYREPGQVGELVRAIAAIDWPASRREVFLVCEEDDAQTLGAIEAGGLPEGFHLVCCPDSFPRTKPKALNFALPLAKGEFTVVYDAEDRPHRQQLREACRAFRAGKDDLACLQAPLVTGNGTAGWLSAMFGVEYDTLFRGALPALATIGGPVPLGGTSNHFRTNALRACLGWDAWNVTEDADLGLRLARMGYRCGTIEHPTLEEAPETLPVWMRQRTRWLKGWMQTILVHMRHPMRLKRDLGWPGFLVFQLSMTTIVASVLAHPFVLAHAMLAFGMIALGHDLSARQFAYAGLDLFSITASYATYGLLAGAVARRCGKRVGLRMQLTLPAYWLLISAAGWRAALQFVREPFKWEKTEHGLAKPTASANIETRFPAKDA